MATANHRRSVRDTATPGSARMLTTPRSTNGLNLSGSSASSAGAVQQARLHPAPRTTLFDIRIRSRPPAPRCGGLAVLPAQPDIFPPGLAHSHCVARATPIHQSTADVPAHTVLKRRFTAGHRRSCRYGIECVLLHQAKGQVFVLMLFDRLDRALARIPLISDGRARYYHVSQRYLLHVG